MESGKQVSGAERLLSAGARVTGRVRVGAGVAVRDVLVVIGQFDTATYVQTVTNEEGFYQFDALAPGKYVIEVKTAALKELAGSTGIRKQVALTDGETRVVDFIVTSDLAATGCRVVECPQ